MCVETHEGHGGGETEAEKQLELTNSWWMRDKESVKS